MSNLRRNVERFFKNPITMFIIVVGIGAVTVCFANRTQQIYGIVGLFLVFGVGSIIYSAWQERVSSSKYREENDRLLKQIEVLTSENAKLAATASDLEQDIPKVIVLASVYKKIQLGDSDGNAEISLCYEGTNVSGMAMENVRHVIFTENPLNTGKVLEASINREQVKPEVKCEPSGKGHRCEIILEAADAIKDKSPIATSYKVLVEKEYTSAFREGGTSETEHSVYLRTNSLTVEINAPQNYYFPNPRVEVRDLFNRMEIYNEEDRLQSEHRPRIDTSRRRILWVIPNPRISYSYVIRFSARKETGDGSQAS